MSTSASQVCVFIKDFSLTLCIQVNVNILFVWFEFNPSQWTSPQKVGELRKQGAIRKNWKKRWFVLQDDNLFYFKSKSVRIFDHTISILTVIIMC